MKKDVVLDALKRASQGLRYTSETDADLEPFAWAETGKFSRARLLELAQAEKGTPVEETTLDDFFHSVPSEDRPQFQKLAKVLREQLSGVKVYKVGEEAEKDVYILGKATDGRWAGLKTTVVET